MSSILKPWELKPSEEVYVIKYDPLETDDHVATVEAVDETMEQRNKKEYNDMLIQMQQRELAQQQILLRQEQEILQKANLRADYIMNTAISRAKHEEEKILGEAMVEADRIKDNAFRMGYDEGFEKAQGELLNCIERFEGALEEVKHAHMESVENIKREIEMISLAVAEKILKKRLEENPLELLNLVEHLIGENKQAKWIKVQLSDKMEELIDHVQAVLVPKYPQLSVEKVNKPEGSCIMDTPDGVTDASVETQLENIKKALKDKMQ